MKAFSHILVVDDEPVVLESLCELLLAQEGYTVSRAADGREAMNILQAVTLTAVNPVDLVLLDARMPFMSGLEVLAWIRNHPELKYLRVMMLTAASGNREKVEALSAGADDYITKPYYPYELLARVRTMLRSRELEWRLQRQSQQLATLNRVSNTVTATLESGPIMAAAVDGARSIIEIELAAVHMFNPGQNSLQCQQLSADDQTLATGSFQPIPVNKGFIGRVFTKQAASYLNGPLAPNPANTGPASSGPSVKTLFQKGVDAPADFPVRSILATPLVVRGRPVGVLSAYNKKDGPFSEVDVDLFASLGGSVARAIENAWLFQRVKMRQQELLENRSTLYAVIDGILHPIYTISQDWRIVAVNKTRVEALPSTPAALVGQSCFQAFFGRNTPCEHCAVSLTLAEKQAHRWLVQQPGSNHSGREWEVNAYPIPGTKNGAAHAVVVWQDMTEARRLERSLIQAGKLAAIGELAAGVAHEINNPLSVINASGQMLKMAIATEDSNYELAELITLAGERAAKVVRGLLDFSRQEEYQFNAANVNDSLVRALDLIAHQLQSANIVVERRLAAELPDVIASWDHMTSVWINLLINARDAVLGLPDERRVEIETRLTPAGDQVQILVRDNGSGVPPADLEHIFEPFYTTKEPGQGTGLGLATCHRIVLQHGGTIEAVSNANAGTCFIVQLMVSNNSTTAKVLAAKVTGSRSAFLAKQLPGLMAALDDTQPMAPAIEPPATRRP